MHHAAALAIRRPIVRLAFRHVPRFNGRMQLTRRRSGDRQDCWLIYYGGQTHPAQRDTISGK
jgi:hypothetical protein